MFHWLSGHDPSQNIGVHSIRRKATSIEIDGRGNICSVAFLADRKHVLSGGNEGKIRHWSVEDGKEVGEPMDAGSGILSLALSCDAKWIVSGTRGGSVMVWDAESQELVVELKGHGNSVFAVDISPDGMRVATGSDDKTVCVWSLPTGAQLLGPWQHKYELAGVKFSLDGLFIATATWNRESIRVYDSQNSNLLFDVPIRVNLESNGSLAWRSNSKQLFVLSHDGHIRCLDVPTGMTLLRWSIHNGNHPRCISLATNDKFIAASNGTSVSFWDTVTHQQIGSVIQYPYEIWFMAISAQFHFAVGGNKNITLRNLRDILPSRYFYAVSDLATKHVEAQKADQEETVQV